jgi:hypothetical protein
MRSSKAGNGGDLIGDRTDRAPHGKKFASGSTLGKYQVNYAKPWEITYFYTLHFVLEVYKQQQMPSLCKTLGDALSTAIVTFTITF